MTENGAKLPCTLWDLYDWRLPLDKEDVLNSLLDRRGPMPGFTLVLDRSLKSAVLPMPGSRFCGHDWWICAVAFMFFHPIAIPQPLVNYRLHSNQASGAGNYLLDGTPFKPKKRLIDLQRIKSNFSREWYRLRHRRQIKERKAAERTEMMEEMDKALKQLSALVPIQGGLSKAHRTRLSEHVTLLRNRL
jgi:hypothetical protein